MNIRRWTTPLALTGALALCACADSAPQADVGAETEEGAQEDAAPLNEADYNYDDWDLGAEATLGREELGTWAEEKGWRRLDEEGFAETAFGLWDLDADGIVSEREWTLATERWYGDVDEGDWGDWDRDGDSALTLEEAREGVATRGVFGRVDRNGDGVVDGTEMGDWLLESWDADADRRVGRGEWRGGG